MPRNLYPLLRNGVVAGAIGLVWPLDPPGLRLRAFGGARDANFASGKRALSRPVHGG